MMPIGLIRVQEVEKPMSWMLWRWEIKQYINKNKLKNVKNN